jgi:hypothetical protein
METQNRYIVDTKFMDIVDEIRPGDRIVRAESIESLAQFEKVPSGETFTKLYHKVVPLLVETALSASELVIFLHLAVNLRYVSNVAKYHNGKLITRANIISDLKIPEVTVKRSIYRLIKVGLIVEANTIEGKVFIVNPFVVMVGDKINKTVYDLFRKSKWARW